MFTPPRAMPNLQNALLDTRPVDAGLQNLGNALAERRQRMLSEQIGAAAAGGDLEAARDAAYRGGNLNAGMGFGNALAQRKMRNERLKLAQQQASQGRVMNVGGNLVRVGPNGRPEVLYSPPKNDIDQRIKEAQLKKLQQGDPLKDIKARVLQQLLGPGQQQAPAQAEPRVQLQSGEVTTTDPNLIQAQTAEQAPAAPQQSDALANLTPEQRKAMALNLVSPGLGNPILQAQKGEQFQKPAINKIETRMLDSEEGYSRLQSIQKQFRPEYQRFTGKGKAAWFALKDKFGVLPPEERQYLHDFSQYRQSAAQNLNLYIKEITGAQMSEPEAKRLSKGVPVAGNGIFDGDSPTEFQAKMKQSMLDLALVRMRTHYLRSGGWRGTVMSAEDIARAAKSGNLPITLPQMRSIFNGRVKQLQKSGMQRSQAIGQAKQEFGI
jgi:hypothetical protein